MDQLLLTLWKHIQTGPVKQGEIADTLQLSPKQTARKLKKWQAEGWIEFKAGMGRGRVSSLRWINNPEFSLLKQALHAIVTEPVETGAKYLMLDWSADSRAQLLKAFRFNIGYEQAGGDKLIVSRKYPFLSFEPPMALEVHSANLVANLYNRVVSLDEGGRVIPELAHSWEVDSHLLRLYIRKGVKFHDGSVLSADDIIACLSKLMVHPFYQAMWEPVTEIRSPAPLVVELVSYKGCSYMLQLLSALHASIFKKSHTNLVGTGGFYLSEDHNTKTVLSAFEDYFQERPFLDSIEFVQMPPDFDVIYRTATEEQIPETFKVESDSGFGVVVMNAYRDSDIKRQEVREYIHYLIDRHRHEIDEIHPMYASNDRGIFVGESEKHIIPEIPKPDIKGPILVQVVEQFKAFSYWVQDILEQRGIPVELVPLPFVESLQNGIQDNGVDLFITGEVLEMNQDFSCFQFFSAGHSPIAAIMRTYPELQKELKRYRTIPFRNWRRQHLAIEKKLKELSLMIPLYYAKRSIPFSTDIVNINIGHFGYVDFSKLWIKPQIGDRSI